MPYVDLNEKKLQQISDSEKRYNILLLQSPFAISIMKGSDMVITLANDSIKGIFGKGDHIEGKPLFEVLPELKDSVLPAVLNEVYDTGIQYQGVEILAPIYRNGQLDEAYFNLFCQPYLEEDEAISGIIVTVHEVTEHVLLKQELVKQRGAEQKVGDAYKTANDYIQNVFMQAPALVCMLRGPEHVYELVNEKYLKLIGHKNIIGKSVREAFPEMEGQGFFEIMDEVYKTGKSFVGNEIPAKFDNGSGKMEDLFFNFVDQATYDINGNIDGILMHGIEVTEQVLVRKKLEESEHRFQAAVAAVKGILWTNNAIGEMEGEQQGWASLTGQSYEEYQGYGWANVIHPDDAAPTVAAWNEAVNERRNFIFEHRVKLKNGNWGRFSVNAIPLLNSNGLVREWVGVHTDITEQRHLEEAVKESEKHFRLMADLMPAKISNADAEGSVLYFNKQWLDFTGLNFEKLKDFGYQNIMHPDELEEFQSRLHKAAEMGANLEMEMRFKNKEGEYKWHLNLASPVKDENGKIKMWVGSTTEIHEQKTAAEKIKESEGRFRALVLQAPVAICVLRGRDFVIETINERMVEMWDRKIEDVLNKPAFDVLEELRDQGLKELLDGVYNTGERFVAEELPISLMRNEKLESIFIKFIYEPIREADGTISGVMALAHEITAQVIAKKQIQESEEKYRQLVDSMPQKITNADTEGNVTFFNKQWVDDTGFPFEELKGWGWRKVMHPEDLERIMYNWTNCVATGNLFEIECRILNKEGEYKWHLSRALPIKDENGKIKMWVGTNTDIHEQKEAKSKAEAATCIAEVAVKAKQQFLSNMSHEIRTPMNAIIGFTNVLLKTGLNKKQQEYINAIKISGDALIVLINDILDIAKVDAGKMTFEQTPFELSASISAMLQVFEPKIQEKKLELVKEYDSAIPKVIMGDSVRLRQIILNLVSNAVKFTAEGKITLRVSLLKEEEDKVAIEFAVTDTGIGIPQNKLEHIFDDFEQVHTETNNRKYGGTGLGLSIVKQFVELQGGTLIVKSELGKGSTFGFVLNFKKSSTLATTAISAKTITDDGGKLAERIKNTKILVVEDIKLNQLLIKIILTDFGFELDTASNGKIAIEKLKKNKFDIVLMDLQMPEMNGFEATEYIRNTMSSQIPIIALTADVTTVDVERCGAVGMNDYISKPIDEKLLYDKIIKHLHKN